MGKKKSPDSCLNPGLEDGGGEGLPSFRNAVFCFS
jgi:hypothetical protein